MSGSQRVLQMGAVLSLLPWWSGAFDPQPGLYAPPHPLAASSIDQGLQGELVFLLPLEEWTAVGGTYHFEHLTTIPQTDVDIKATAVVSGYGPFLLLLLLLLLLISLSCYL